MNVSETIKRKEREESEEIEKREESEEIREREEEVKGPPEAPVENKSYYRLEDARFGVLGQFHRNRPWILDLGGVWDRPAGPGDTPFRWGIIEREKGVYDWRVADDCVRWCSQNNRLLIGMIFPYAEWDQIEGYGDIMRGPRMTWMHT